ncbi:MerR family transcriptional regulator [Paenibacillus ginsengarvi]|uniref:MerR family transcriptional regulator n=1 Tax=Paenibacillus ginsengarvi TaxID=400777 RepID=A0A3B0CJM3_9BACL|nr:MerR family transcriptional regulator [Paenibacillus ginsengarvi]RKN85031.1 MerR family transcriptional regulator [Paenibacillus ginsengarvi]
MKHYRIGELARLAQISSRTIDYYTKLGLIYPEKRSKTNYRLYTDETLARLKRIETMKQEKYSLEEIKASLDAWNKVSQDEAVTEKLTSLGLHLRQLEREVKELSPLLAEMKPRQAKYAFNTIAAQSAACIDALLLLLGKGPFM